MKSIVAGKDTAAGGKQCCREQTLVGHTASTAKKPKVNRKECQAPKPEAPSPQTHFPTPKGSPAFLNSALSGDQLPMGTLHIHSTTDDKIFQEEYSIN